MQKTDAKHSPFTEMSLLLLRLVPITKSTKMLEVLQFKLFRWW